MRYKVNKIGFVNFWLYDEEEFYFYDGKLLLRGTNGSGKTVTMQSFFPLIFDGNKSPERLDPFGSRDRKIEDYLLPEDFAGNENTGYLYMEFYNKEEDKYLTIGIGLRAIRNRNTEFWGFGITDNRRIGDDILLFKEKNLRIPLTKKELQNRIGTGGIFVDTQKEYKKMVNSLLFGFPSVDMYTEFINLLIQVRSPKLSNSTRPRQLTSILSSVLEPLSKEDLRVMADSIEDMNKYKETLADLQNEQKACNSLKNSYQEYNRSVLYDKGQNYLDYRQKLNKIEQSVKENNKKIEELINTKNIENQNKKNLELEQQELEHRKNRLEESDLKSISVKLDEIIDTIKDLENQYTNKEKEQNQKEEVLAKNKNELKQKEDELYNIKKEFDDLLKNLTDYETEIDFDDAKFYLDDLKLKRLEFNDMTSYVKTIKKQVELLKEIESKSYEIYQKELEINNEKEKYKENDDKIGEIEKQKQEISSNLLEQCDKFKEQIAKQSQNNKILNIEQNNLNEIYRIIDDLDREMFSKIKDIIKNQTYIYKDKLKNEISNNNIKINEFNSKIKELKLKIENINNILIKNLDDDNTKNYFSENNVKYNYFFELIDFKDGLNLDVKKRIESFLFEVGVLTSFVTDINIDNIDIKAKCINYNSKQNDNLTTYLKACPSQFRDKVTKILESISISNDSKNNNIINITDTGKYNFALLNGKTDKNYELKYIGYDTRKDYIENQKEIININIKKYEKENYNLEEENIKLNSDIDNLDNEFNNFSYPNIILDLFKSLDKANIDLEIVNDNISKLMDVIKEKNSELKNLVNDMELIKKGYYGSIKYQDISKVLKSTLSYLEVLQCLSNTFDNYSTKRELVDYYKNNIDDINIDLDNISYEIESIEFKISDAKNKKKTLDDILNSDKYRDVGREYTKIKERLGEIIEDLKTKIGLISRFEANIENMNNVQGNLKEELNNCLIFKNVSYKIFMDEYNLHYIDNKELGENKIYGFVKSIKTTNNPTVRDIYDKFVDAVSKYTQFLMNYSSKNITLHVPNTNEYLNFTNDTRYEDEITNMLESAKRRDLVFNYKGKNVNLLELSSIIDNSIITYKDLISDENRRLFEDLLINNIGSSIRTKINLSEEWIGEVRKLMESMNTTSGLSFSLKWNGIAALTEDEVDTKEIVNIFKKDPKILKEEDLAKITNHFRSKINMREEVLEEAERNYLEIIKDVLDYRKWFEFKLFYKREGRQPKELTDREFNKMSGGEKAIAMYIPLFSSIYAKLNSALKTAPHVIALDEAFAGVDDENIKDAFRILDRLDIDYVLTSQQLWGDYETIKHLAISELHHPTGSKVVTIIKYKWDGISRTQINKNEEYND